MPSRAIGEYALLSDCRSAALVSRDGTVDWLCFPRFDSPAVFAGLLDDDGGHWSLRPTGEASAQRRYVDGTMVLETSYRTSGGAAVVVDAMAVGRNDRGHDLGAESPGVLLRRVTCTEGSMAFALQYAPTRVRADPSAAARDRRRSRGSRWRRCTGAVMPGRGHARRRRVGGVRTVER